MRKRVVAAVAAAAALAAALTVQTGLSSPLAAARSANGKQHCVQTNDDKTCFPTFAQAISYSSHGAITDAQPGPGLTDRLNAYNAGRVAQSRASSPSTAGYCWHNEKYDYYDSIHEIWRTEWDTDTVQKSTCLYGLIEYDGVYSGNTTTVMISDLCRSDHHWDYRWAADEGAVSGQIVSNDGHGIGSVNITRGCWLNVYSQSGVKLTAKTDQTIPDNYRWPSALELQ